MSEKTPSQPHEDFDELAFEQQNAPPPQAPLKIRRSGIMLPLWAKMAVAGIAVFVVSIAIMQRGQHSDHVATELEKLDQQTMEDRKPAPEIEVTTESGSKIKLSSLKGSVVVLSFWASWCEPCLLELPSFKHLHTQLSEKGLKIFAVNVDENESGLKERIGGIWKEASMPFPNHFDYDQSAANTFKIDRLPANFILDKQGRIVATTDGWTDWGNGPILEMIDALLAEKN